MHWFYETHCIKSYVLQARASALFFSCDFHCQKIPNTNRKCICCKCDFTAEDFFLHRQWRCIAWGSRDSLSLRPLHWRDGYRRAFRWGKELSSSNSVEKSADWPESSRRSLWSSSCSRGAAWRGGRCPGGCPTRGRSTWSRSPRPAASAARARDGRWRTQPQPSLPASCGEMVTVRIKYIWSVFRTVL